MNEHAPFTHAGCALATVVVHPLPQPESFESALVSAAVKVESLPSPDEPSEESPPDPALASNDEPESTYPTPAVDVASPLASFEEAVLVVLPSPEAQPPERTATRSTTRSTRWIRVDTSARKMSVTCQVVKWPYHIAAAAFGQRRSRRRRGPHVAVSAQSLVLEGSRPPSSCPRQVESPSIASSAAWMAARLRLRTSSSTSSRSQTSPPWDLLGDECRVRQFGRAVAW
jgi:hypothetical protein